MKNGRMGNFNRAYLCFLVAFAVALPGVVYASYTANPRLPTTYWIGSDGLWRSSATIEAKSPTNPTKYLKATVPLSPASIGRLAKGAMGGPLGIAITAAMVGYSVWDGMDFKTPGSPMTGGAWVAYTGTADTSNTADLFTAGDPDSACAALLSSDGVTPFNPNYYLNSELQGTCKKIGNNNYGVLLHSCGIYNNTYIRSDSTSCTDPNLVLIETPSTVLTDDEVGNFIKSDPTLTRDIANDSIERRTWRGQWTEMDTATDNIEGSLDRVADGTASTSDNDLDQGAGVAPPSGSASGETTVSVQVEFPIFCSWATIVCDFLDWYRSPSEEPPHPDLPVTEVTLSTWDSGLGAGTCPSSYTATFQGQSITYPFDDACWAATTIFKPILLTISLIGAGLIIVGRA